MEKDKDDAAAAPGPLKRWFLAARPHTLPAAAIPVMVGTALAARLAEWQAVPALLCLLFALLVQVGTNFANDHFDFIKGADTADRVGPTRMVAKGWIPPSAMLRATFAVFAAAFFAGLFLVFYGGWWLVGIGAASILCGLGYTAGPFPLAYKGLGDLFVFTFFGLIAVSFTFYVQAGYFPTEGWLAGAAVGALAVNILVVNNYRDMETDARAGKRTLVVRYGRRFALVEYGVMTAVAFAVPIFFWWQGLRLFVLMPMVLLPVAAALLFQLPQASGGGANLLLRQTALLLLRYGIFFSAGIILG